MNIKLSVSSYETVRPIYGTIFIHTPGIDQVPNYWLVQKLIEHRIRCMLQQVPFDDISFNLVQQYLTVPPTIEKEVEVTNWLKTQALELRTSFNTYEETNRYKDAMALLVPHKGRPFSITSITMAGIQLMIDLLPG